MFTMIFDMECGGSTLLWICGGSFRSILSRNDGVGKGSATVPVALFGVSPNNWCGRIHSPFGALVLRFINTTTFAARDFRPRRGASDAHTLQRSVRSEQRRLGRKEPPPGGLRRFSVLASLLLGHSPTSGML